METKIIYCVTDGQNGTFFRSEDKAEAQKALEEAVFEGARAGYDACYEAERQAAEEVGEEVSGEELDRRALARAKDESARFHELFEEEEIQAKRYAPCHNADFSGDVDWYYTFEAAVEAAKAWAEESELDLSAFYIIEEECDECGAWDEEGRVLLSLTGERL